MPVWTERRKCPKEFQDRLTRIGGLNRYGEPNFKLEWGQTFTVRRGWTDRYRDILDNFNEPCWVLYQWHPPEEFGSPALYYLQNRDELTGLQALGEFPYRGRYQQVNSFKHKYVKNSKMCVEYMVLNNTILDLVVPVIIQAKTISEKAKQAALKEMKARKEKAELEQITDRLQDAYPAFGGEAVSFGAQGCRTSLIDKKVEQMQRNWSQAMRRLSNLSGSNFKGRGIVQR